MDQVHLPNNHFTDLIERARQANISGNRGPLEAVISGGPTPTVRSASLGNIMPAPELTEQEISERDAKLIELGILPPNPEQAVKTREIIAAEEIVYTPRALQAKQTGIPSAPRLPDFSKVQGIDLVRNVVYLDGMEFPISEEDARDMRIYVVTTAQNTIMAQLNSVLNFLLPVMAETNKDGEEGASNVSSVRQSERFSSGDQGGQSGVQSVPALEQMELQLSSERPARKTRTGRKAVTRVGKDTNK